LNNNILTKAIVVDNPNAMMYTISLVKYTSTCLASFHKGKNNGTRADNKALINKYKDCIL
jgi:hypothetical protein